MKKLKVKKEGQDNKYDNEVMKNMVNLLLYHISCTVKGTVYVV